MKSLTRVHEAEAKNAYVAGKTTLIRILATLVRPDAGTATVAGHDLLNNPVGVRRAISRRLSGCRASRPGRLHPS